MVILDAPSNICLNSSERTSDDRGPRFNDHWDHILLLDIFLFLCSKACDPNIAIIANLDYFVIDAISDQLRLFSSHVDLILQSFISPYLINSSISHMIKKENLYFEATNLTKKSVMEMFINSTVTTVWINNMHA